MLYDTVGLRIKRIYKGMQLDRLKKIAVSDSSQSLVNARTYIDYIRPW